MPEPALVVEKVSRSFGSSDGRTISALQNVSFKVEQGERVALLGTNGAGKTTLAKVISTLLLPSEGAVRVCGADVVTQTELARRSMSVIFGGDRGFYGVLSGRENLRYFGALSGVSLRQLKRQIPDLLQQVGLYEDRNRRVEEYSKGMRQRLHIAAGLLSNPQLLVLDEPTVGLDPIEAARLRESVVALEAQNVAVLLTSHMLLDVERIVDRVLMLQRGTLTHDMSLREFAASAGYEARVTAIVRPEPDMANSAWGSWSVTEDGMHRFELEVESWDAGAFAGLAEALAGRHVLDLSVRGATLEEAFAAIATTRG